MSIDGILPIGKARLKGWNLLPTWR